MIRSLPNLISLARLALVPVVLRAIWTGQFKLALIWCAVAGCSDGLDGFLARRLRATSRTGAYLDPLADKFLLGGTYLTLGWAGIIPWWLTAIVFGRDGLMLLSIAYALVFTRIRDFKPTIWGKISTAIQIVTAMVVLFSRAFPAARFWQFTEPIMVALTVVATAWSAIHYAWVGMRLLGAARAGPAAPLLD